QFGPVHDREIPQAAQVALLDRRQLVIEQHQRGARLGQPGTDFVGLAGTDEQRRVGTGTSNGDPVDRRQASGSGQGAELVERVVGPGGATEGDADQQAGNGGFGSAQVSGPS